MTAERRSFAGAAPATTLSSGINNSATSFSVASGGGTGYPTGSGGNFLVVADRGQSTEEKILCSARATDTFTVATSGRGYDGTSAQAHASGAVIEHCIGKTDVDEANLAVSKTIGQATAVGQILVVDAANSFAAVQAKTSGQVLIGNGTTLASTPLSGDVTVNGSGVTAIGSGKVSSAMIVDATIATGDLADGAVTSAKIADATIAAGDIASDAVTTAKILDANVTTAKLAANAVTTAKIASGAVTTTEIADATIAAGDLASNAVTTAKILDANVTTAKIADANVTLAKMASEAGTAFTPTVAGTGWAIGNGTRTGIYYKVNRFIHVDILITWGSGSTFGAGSLTVGALPVAVQAGIGTSARVFLIQTGASADFYGDWSVAAGGTSGIVYFNAVFSAPGAVFRTGVTSGGPFAWASGDQVELHLDYIAAS